MSDKIFYLKINSYNLKQHEETLKKICMSSHSDKSEASKNIHWNNWQNNKSSIMHHITRKRFDDDKGEFYILLKNAEPIACSGCYISPWSKEVTIIGSRTWTIKNSRKNWWQGKYLFPKQLDFAIRKKSKAIVLTFNLYNIWLQNFLKRVSQNKSVSFGTTNASFYKDFIFYNDIYYINNTPQKIAVKLLNCTKEEFKQNYLPPKI